MTVNTDQMRGLDSRTSDGINVRLLWHRHDDRVTVAVDDAKTGDAFTIDVRELRRSRKRLAANPRARAGPHRCVDLPHGGRC